MQPYQVTETINPGLPVIRDQHPYIPTPPSCPPLVLSDALVSAIQEERAQGSIRYGVARRPLTENGVTRWLRVAENMHIEVGEDRILLGGKTPKQDQTALVNLCWAAGVGGHITLTSDAYTKVWRRNEVVRKYGSFPDVGVEPLCSPSVVDAMNGGTEHLDVFVVMRKGSRILMERTGRLEGAPPRLSIGFDGKTLEMFLPRRYSARPRGVPFFEATA